MSHQEMSAVRQWVYTRYAILVGLKKSELLEMLLRRHELAMACVARGIQDAVDQEAEAAAACHPVDTYPEAQATRSVASASGTDTAFFAHKSGESFRAWVERLQATLPALLSNTAVAIIPEVDDQDTLVVRTTREGVAEARPSKGRLRRDMPTSALVAGTDRVAYEAGLPYTQFVAALGIQLLLPAQQSAAAGRSWDARIQRRRVAECMLAMEVRCGACMPVPGACLLAK
jgi:hypothetical protein